jgi:hypothetical protein
MFYRYLSGLDKYAGISASQYHSLFDNEDIQRWQVARQKARKESGRAAASSTTIFDEAKLGSVHIFATGPNTQASDAKAR